MKKNDYICLFLSIVINIAILFVLAMFLTNEIVETDEIKIGLISTESDASTRFKGEKNVDAKIRLILQKNICETFIYEASEKDIREVL